MMAAPLGDACWGDDPTVLRLEALAAERLGKEAAIFVPSGSMSNQCGVAVHAGPGEAALVEARAHLNRWEGGGSAASSGVQHLSVEAEDGLPTVAQWRSVLPPDHVKAVRVRVLCFENTHNASGGRVHRPAALAERAAWARSEGFAVHLDGARLWNAVVATGEPAAAFAELCDTVSLCLSKGLGAPIGSILAGDRDLIAEADRVRHRLGGGWRQAGLLAAAGIYALDHHVERLADDHARARRLEEAMEAAGVARATHPVDSNLIGFVVDPAWGSAPAWVDALREGGVLGAATSPTTGRLVTHLDADDAAIDHACRIIGAIP